MEVLKATLGARTPVICLFQDSTGGASEITLNTTDEERARIGHFLTMPPEKVATAEGAIKRTVEKLQ